MTMQDISRLREEKLKNFEMRAREFEETIERINKIREENLKQRKTKSIYQSFESIRQKILERQEISDSKTEFETLIIDLENALDVEIVRLRRIRRLVGKIMNNSFFKNWLSKDYNSGINSIKNELDKILLRKRRASREIWKFFQNPIKIFQNGKEYDLNFLESRSVGDLESLIGKYSDEICLPSFLGRATLENMIDEVGKKISSKTFSKRYLECLIEKLNQELEREVLRQERIERIIENIVVELIRNEHTIEDLKLKFKGFVESPGEFEERFEILSKKIKSKPRRWVLLSSIRDLQISVARLTVGSVTFYDRGNFDLKKWVEQTGMDNFEKIADQLKTKSAILKNPTLVEVYVSAHGSTEAVSKANEEIARSIDLLSFYFNNYIIIEPRFMGRCDVFGVDLEKKQGRLHFERRPVVSIRKEDLEAISQLQDLNKALKKSRESVAKLEGRLVRGIRWLRKANMSKNLADKVVDYVISLESLVVKANEAPSRVLPERVIDIAWIRPNFEPEIEKFVRSIYIFRGRIVHGGITESSWLESKIRTLRDLVKRILLAIAEATSDCETLDEFLAYNEKRISEAREEELKKAVFPIGQEFVGEGKLRKMDGSVFGRIRFTLNVIDDGKFVVKEGEILDFQKVGRKFSANDKFHIEGRIIDVDSKIRTDNLIIGMSDLLGLFFGEKKRVWFRAPSVEVVS